MLSDQLFKGCDSHSIIDGKHTRLSLLFPLIDLSPAFSSLLPSIPFSRGISLHQ